MIQLIIADDHMIFRQGLAQLLGSHEGIEIVGQAGSGEEALAMVREQQPDVAILDISMPGLNGIEVSKAIVDEGLSSQILLLTMHDDPTLALKAEQIGVKGYVVKDNAFAELLDAIHAVAKGKRFVSGVVEEKLGELCPTDDLPPTLSPREQEVVRLIAAGHTNKEMARDMGISPKTVDTHRTRLMRKLNLHSTADVVRYAVRMGLA
uniref:Two component transcriptional regulator, LuxR family n=1 Tax=Magnetococcus massalia (strain MO-1) TaxID=451514 RepID=A0A1S7LEG9_MAGMO|nr:Two component transcriptional regulator, LuxR family [Candidatus Magnetococcus massalia]